MMLRLHVSAEVGRLARRRVKVRAGERIASDDAAMGLLYPFLLMVISVSRQRRVSIGNFLTVRIRRAKSSRFGLTKTTFLVSTTCLWRKNLI